MKCPICGRVKAVVQVGDLYHCHGCGATFDKDDEGISAPYDDPVKSAMKNEERRKDQR